MEFDVKIISTLAEQLAGLRGPSDLHAYRSDDGTAVGPRLAYDLSAQEVAYGLRQAGYEILRADR